MSEQLVSMDKEYRTRDGKEVRVLCVDTKLATGESVAGIITQGPTPRVTTWYKDGAYLGEVPHGDDLIEVRPTVKVDCWLNVYSRGGISIPYETKEVADIGVSSERIACIHIERDVEHGEGL